MFDDSLKDEATITVIATGLENQEAVVTGRSGSRQRGQVPNQGNPMKVIDGGTGSTQRPVQQFRPGTQGMPVQQFRPGAQGMPGMQGVPVPPSGYQSVPNVRPVQQNNGYHFEPSKPVPPTVEEKDIKVPTFLQRNRK